MKKIIYFLLIAIISLSFTSCKDSKKDLGECENHITSLAQACNLYSSHNDGHYPENLEQLVEKGIMRKIPQCPVCKKPYIYFSQRNPDFLIIKCPVENAHKDTGSVGEGCYPVYTTKEGVVTRGEYSNSLNSSGSSPTEISAVNMTPTTEAVLQETPASEISPTEAPDVNPQKTPVKGPTKEIKKVNPQAKSHNDKGLQYLKEDKYDLALSEFNEAIKIDPDYLDAIKNKGNVYYYKDDTKKALEFYELTVSKDPSYWNGYNNIGNVYFDGGDVDKAEEYYRKAMECCKDDIKPFNNLGDILIEKQMYDEAIDNYSKAVELGLENAELYCQMGFCYWQKAQKGLEEGDKKGAWEEANKALEYFGKASDLDSTDAVPHFRAGIVYFNFGPDYFDNAIKCIDKAIKLKPDNPAYLYSRGQICQARGDVTKAQKDYKRALKLAQTAKDKEMEDKIKEALSSLNKK